jgi:hypothetical protein
LATHLGYLNGFLDSLLRFDSEFLKVHNKNLLSTTILQKACQRIFYDNLAEMWGFLGVFWERLEWAKSINLPIAYSDAKYEMLKPTF